MGKKTALFNWHQSHGARLVDFSGWDMPVNYGSQIEEHHAVRQSAGVFDVSHMTVIDVSGNDAKAYLQALLANDVARLDGTPGKALYSGMLNEQGGVIDDLIVYLMDDIDAGGSWYRVVVNCGTREKDLAWMNQQAEPFTVTLQERDDMAMIALQGPQAIRVFNQVAAADLQTQVATLAVFQGVEYQGTFYARTGYTGEEGLEIIVPNDQVEALWQEYIDAGAMACGLGARDTLRLEAGMNLYGNEMDDSVSPLAANMGWTIAWEPQAREYIGKAAVLAEKQSPQRQQLIGLCLHEKGVLRAHQRVQITDANGGIVDGEITSGTFSPTLGYSIAMARIPASVGSLSDQHNYVYHVEIRNKLVPVKRTKTCFVRHGQSLVDG